MTKEPDSSLHGKYTPRLMEWGIINKQNFHENDIKYIPIKRWDPLSTSLITTKEFGYEEGYQRYFGHYSYISPIRAKRSLEFKKKTEEKEDWEDCSEKYTGYKDVFSVITEGGPVD
ncbi:MAG: hypothetical protein EU548_10065, partial [Promethearchaeota archaeon]